MGSNDKNINITIDTDKKIFGFGRRWDTWDVKTLIDFNTVNKQELYSIKGRLHGDAGIDYFLDKKDE